MSDQDEAREIAIRDFDLGKGPMQTDNLPPDIADAYNKSYNDAEKQQVEAAQPKS